MDDRLKKSRLQEKRITKKLSDFGARQTIASGSKWISKSDVVTNKCQIECKTKIQKSKSFTIKKEWLEKVSMEAFENKKMPILVFSFGDGKDYYVLDEDSFINLLRLEDE